MMSEREKLPPGITRRAFLGTSAKLALGVAGALAGTSGLFVYGAMKHRDKGIPVRPGNIVELGELRQLMSLNVVMKMNYEAIYEDAWISKPVKGSVYVTTEEDGSLLIMSPACTHLGCTIAPATDEERREAKNDQAFFRCPCHGALFDRRGHSVFLDLKRLDLYEPIIEGGWVYFDIMKPIKQAEA
ncbi:Rieske (2Fe-2S) protein [Paenibacillus silvisoli]|uniref:Rieske (2Fe-2S) protein n=1 Tax=Paenibacillus silvisoli TaxID=3110539 RepID=UPI0028054351|nr:Rieske 2Fe-2S domain-containing protein [Paenibacillus silvisoli]